MPQSKMIDPEICDLMISSYLSNPLFKRFNKVLINTVFANFSENTHQLLTRKFPPGTKKTMASEWRNLGFKTVESAQQFHKEAYKSWERNLHALKPEKIYFTKVDNNNGDLLINNNTACENWKGKTFPPKEI